MNSAKIFREAFDLLKIAEGYIPKLNGDNEKMERFYNNFSKKRDDMMDGYKGTDDEELAEDLLFAVSRRIIKLCEYGGKNNEHHIENR